MLPECIFFEAKHDSNMLRSLQSTLTNDASIHNILWFLCVAVFSGGETAMALLAAGTNCLNYLTHKVIKLFDTHVSRES